VQGDGWKTILSKIHEQGGFVQVKAEANWKPIGWMFCSSPKKNRAEALKARGLSDEQLYCRMKVDEPHWHKIFKTDEGKIVIEWDYIYYEGAPEGEATWSPEYAERQRCAKYHICQSCKELLKGEFNGEDYHSPYWIPLTKWWFWCTKCWEKYFGKDHIDYAGRR
jgi:hypothetical protein